jgi:hypothetical protein
MAFRRAGITVRLVVVLLALASLVQMASYFLKSGKLSFSIYNIYTLVDVVFWAFIFGINQRIKWIRYFMMCLLFLFGAIACWLFLKKGIADHFFTELVCYDSLLLVFWVLYFFYDRYKNGQITQLEHQPLFWFSIGIIIYAPCTYFLFAFRSEILSVKNQTYSWLWNIHGVLNVLMYLLFAVGIGITFFNKKNLINDDIANH